MIGILLAHLVGDYILQSDWMANEKTKRWWPAIAHGVTYGLPFLFVTQSPAALAVIVVTHIVIDHYRLARHVCWVKNPRQPEALPLPVVGMQRHRLPRVPPTVAGRLADDHCRQHDASVDQRGGRALAVR